MIRRIVVVAVVALSAFVLGAASKTKPAGMSKEAKVRRMLEMTGAAEMGNQIMESMVSEVEKDPSVPPGFIPKFRELAKQDDLVSHIVPIYVKYLSDADLDGIIAFYESSAGQHLSAAQPKILQESMDEGRKWGESLAQKANDSVQKKP